MRLLVDRQGVQVMIDLQSLRYAVLVADHHSFRKAAIALGVLAQGNPIVRLLKLALFLIRGFGAKMHPRFAIARFLLNDFERGQCGLGPKWVVHESVNASKRRLLAVGFQLPGSASVKACPRLVFDCDLADGVSILRFEREIEVFSG